MQCKQYCTELTDGQNNTLILQGRFQFNIFIQHIESRDTALKVAYFNGLKYSAVSSSTDVFFFFTT